MHELNSGSNSENQSPTENNNFPSKSEWLIFFWNYLPRAYHLFSLLFYFHSCTLGHTHKNCFRSPTLQLSLRSLREKWTHLFLSGKIQLSKFKLKLNVNKNFNWDSKFRKKRKESHRRSWKRKNKKFKMKNSNLIYSTYFFN